MKNTLQLWQTLLQGGSWPRISETRAHALRWDSRLRDPLPLPERYHAGRFDLVGGPPFDYNATASSDID